jgi:hypothetical protein
MKYLKKTLRWVWERYDDLLFAIICTMAFLLSVHLIRILPDTLSGAIASQLPYILTFVVWQIYLRTRTTAAHIREWSRTGADVMFALTRDLETLSHAHNKLAVKVAELTEAAQHREESK